MRECFPGMNGIPVSRNVPHGKGVFQSFRECSPGMNGSKFKECSREMWKSKALGNVPKGASYEDDKANRCKRDRGI